MKGAGRRFFSVLFVALQSPSTREPHGCPVSIRGVSREMESFLVCVPSDETRIVHLHVDVCHSSLDR